jgi:hypothetical protein
MIGSARSEKADVSLFNELVQLPRGVMPRTRVDDARGGVLKLIDVFFSAICELY